MQTTTELSPAEQLAQQIAEAKAAERAAATEDYVAFLRKRDKSIELTNDDYLLLGEILPILEKSHEDVGHDLEALNNYRKLKSSHGSPEAAAKREVELLAIAKNAKGKMDEAAEQVQVWRKKWVQAKGDIAIHGTNARALTAMVAARPWILELEGGR